MQGSSIHLITGGQRSGKSEYGEKLVLEKSDKPVYLATSKHWDKEFSERIAVHQSRRSELWRTIEEELYLSNVVSDGDFILLDCITLWLNNIMYHFNYDYNKSYAFAKAEWKALTNRNVNIFVISNEIGLGVIPVDKNTRKFVDLQGKINQLIAEEANKVTLMVSGLPLHLKSNE